MLSKKNRVDKKGIDFIFKKGNSVISPSFMFKFVLIDEPTRPRISLIAPKNIARLAFKRNLLRRKGYYVFKKYIKQFSPKILGVFVFKKIEEDILKIENEIKNILNKIN